jgi:hypothetical protein
MTLGTLVNPWNKLPLEAPYVLPEDDAILRGLARRNDLALHLLPVPFHGDPRQAPVVLLGLNPSYRLQADYDENDSADFLEQHRLTLAFESRVPFFNLDPVFADNGAYRYWHQRLAALIARFGIDRIGKSVASVQWFPYRSPTFTRLPRLLPSQSYGFSLVRQAIQRGATIVLLRSRKLWLEAVPELARMPYIELNAPRNMSVSPGNMPPGAFETLCQRLTSS